MKIVVKVKNKNKEFLDSLFPSKEYIKERGIVSKRVIVYGSQRSGKSVMVNNWAKHAREKYGYSNVHALTTEANISPLMNFGIQDKYVNILFADDLTMVKVKREDLTQFYRLAHKLEDLGRTEGLVITIIAIHDFYAIPKHLRTYYDYLVVRNLPVNEFDEGVIRRKIGIPAFNRLSKIVKLREKDISYYNYSIYWNKFKETGVLDFPLQSQNYFWKFSEVLTKERGNKPSRWIGWGVQYAIFFMRLSIGIFAGYLLIFTLIPILAWLSSLL